MKESTQGPLWSIPRTGTLLFLFRSIGERVSHMVKSKVYEVGVSNIAMGSMSRSHGRQGCVISAEGSGMIGGHHNASFNSE